MLFIIDRYGRAPTGHFWPASNHLIYAFRTLNQDVTFINPTAIMCFQEQINLQTKINFNSNVDTKFYPKDINFENNQLFLKEASIIINNWCETEKKICKVVFSWLPQFNENELEFFLDSINIDLITLAAITNFSSEYILGKKTREIFTHQSFFGELKVKNKTLWVWSENPYAQLNNSIRKLPEFHTVSARNVESNQRKGIGFYGILSPFRGIGEFILISFFNPKIFFVAQGSSFHWSRSWRPYKFRFMRYRKFYSNPIAYLINISVSTLISSFRFSRNLEMTYHAFPTENELEEAIASREALFYFYKLPFSSGIVLTALASGTPVIWMGTHGPLVDLLTKTIPQGKLKYWEIFVPHRLQFKLAQVKQAKVKEVYTFIDYRNELKTIL